MQNDWVVQYHNRYFQLIRAKRVDIRPKMKVTVAQWLDGSIHILKGKGKTPFEEITQQVLQRARKSEWISSSQTPGGDISKVL